MWCYLLSAVIPKFFLTVNTYHLVPGKVNVPNQGRIQGVCLAVMTGPLYSRY